MKSDLPQLVLDALEAIDNAGIKNKVSQELNVFFSSPCLEQGDLDEVKNNLKLPLSIANSNDAVRHVCKAVVEHVHEVNRTITLSKEALLAQILGSDTANKKAKKAIIKPTPISGFLEFTPEVQLRYEELLNGLRKLYSSHGFVPIDTPVVERLEILAAKGGDVDKEIYAITRARSNDDDDSDASVALRYDLTVPLARYVAQHFNEIAFPFKRFHIGNCFRGERPQDGRYRQFTQADIDIINPDNVPLSFDADIPLIVDSALKVIGIDNYVFRISNRKILSGYLTGLEIQDLQSATRILDKIDKIGKDGVIESLCGELNLDADKAEKVVQIAGISSIDSSFVEEVLALGVNNSLLTEGLEDLKYVMDRLQSSVNNRGQFLVDLSITRGFDYYTGTVYEVKWNDHPSIGSIAAGGRYEDLAGSYIRKKLPGVGMSVGLSRIFGKLVQTNAIDVSRKSPTNILVAWEEGVDEMSLHALAEKLRAKGINVEVYFKSDKIQKQLNYANRKAIQYVIFPQQNEIKDLIKEEQTAFDLEAFQL